MDCGDRAYVAGGTNSTDFPTVNPFQANHAGGRTDIFVGRFDAGGTLEFSSFLGSSQTAEGAWGIALDGNGDAYITGYIVYPDLPPDFMDVVSAKINFEGSDNVSCRDLPTITSFSPDSGPISGRTSVTIVGTNFDPNNTQVFFGDSPAASITDITPTSFTAVTPPHVKGLVDVTVTTTSGTVVYNGFKYIGLPTIESIDPNSGPITGGDSITITGTNFVPGDTTITFGGVSAASVVVNSPTSLVAVTPPHTEGVVNVTVATSDGIATFSNGFTYFGAPDIDTVDPDTAPSGKVITIIGVPGFILGKTSVTFGGVATEIVEVINSSTLVVTVPAKGKGKSTVDVTVTTPLGSDTLPGGFTYAKSGGGGGKGGGGKGGGGKK